MYAMLASRDAARQLAEQAKLAEQTKLAMLRDRAHALWAEMEQSADKTALALLMGRSCHTVDDWRWACARAAYKRRANYYDRRAWERELAA